jgi:hypothetical protein
MSPTTPTCPRCGAPQLPGATICRACDQQLDASFDPDPTPAQPVPATPITIIPPGAEAWPILGVLSALGAAGFIAAVALGQEEASYAITMVGLTIFLTLLIIWAAGRANVRQATAFLASDRPLVRWVYTPAEWQDVCTYHYEQLRKDEVPLGCMPAIFGVTGLLTGLLIGADSGLAEALSGAVIGLLIGAGFGGALALPVRLLNRRAAERLRHAEIPATVALGVHELFYERYYFDARYHTLSSIKLARSGKPRLLISRHAHRASLARQFPSEILVPPRMLPAVQEALPRIKRSGAQGDDSAE